MDANRRPPRSVPSAWRMDSTKIAFSRECRRRSARDADARPFHTAWAMTGFMHRRDNASFPACSALCPPLVGRGWGSVEWLSRRNKLRPLPGPPPPPGGLRRVGTHRSCGRRRGGRAVREARPDRRLARFPAVLNHSVMAGHSPSKTGVNALMPGACGSIERETL